MDLTKEALQFLSEPSVTEITNERRHYTNRPLYPVLPPLTAAVNVCTLDGLLGLTEQKIDGMDANRVVLHVKSFDAVEVISLTDDDWGRRRVYVTATPLEVPGFPFGSFHDHERFVIYLQSNFVITSGLVTLLRVASNITQERIRTSEDDGISQQVGQKRGIVMKGSESIPGKVKLSPFRTFPEIDRPISEFAFRVRQKDDTSTPDLALFEADGGAWKLEAMKTIAEYLTAKSKIVVIA